MRSCSWPTWRASFCNGATSRSSTAPPISVESVRRELARYDPADAAEVCRRVRETGSLDLAAAQLLRVSEEVIEEALPADMAADCAAAAAFLSSLESESRRLERARTRIAAWPVVGPLVSRYASRIIRALIR